MGQGEIISDHAFVRWLERVHGLDVDRLKDTMADETIEAAAALGAHAVKKNGVKYIINGGRVVTVVTKEQRVKRMPRCRSADADYDAENGNGVMPDAARNQEETSMLNVREKPDKDKTSGLFSDEQVATLQQQFKSPEISGRTIELTPAVAKAFLERNPGNRTVSAKTVQKYTSDILAGLWVLNGEPIIIADNGEINDGQHRCLAVVQANRPIKTLIVENVPRAARFTTDMGRARTPGDIFTMNGFHDAKNLACVTLLLMTVEKHGALRPTRGGTDTTITKQQIFEYALRNEAELSWASGLVQHSKCGRFRKTILMLSLILIGRNSGRVASELFIDTLVRGDRFTGSDDPIYAARERLLGHCKERYLTPRDMTEIILRAWNSDRAGKRVRQAKIMGTWPEIAR